MIDKPLDQILASDITDIIASGRIEDATLEYKSALPGGSDRERLEFLADVASFANSRGGDILFGIEEDAGKPIRADGVTLADFDALRLQWQSTINSAIAPKISAFEVRAMPGFPKGSLVIVRVFESWNFPHMVTLGGRSKFYVRGAGQRREMDVYELRSAFVASEGLTDRIRGFRDARLGKILSGGAPVAMFAFPTMVVQVLPVGAAFSRSDVDSRTSMESWRELNKPDERNLEPVFSASMRPNLDGFALYSAWYHERFKKTPSYIQVFRNGAVEAVESFYNVQADPPARAEMVMGGEVERQAVTFVRNALTFRRRMNVSGPVLVMLSLLRMCGTLLIPSSQSFVRFRRNFDRDTIVLPDALIDENAKPEDVPSLLHPVFDVFWQSAGFEASPNYDANGSWKPPR